MKIFFSLFFSLGPPARMLVAGLWVWGAVMVGFSSEIFAQSSTATASVPAKDQKEFKDLLEWVYTTMNQQYYLPVSRAEFDRFTEEFPADKVRLLNERTHKTEDYIHLGAGLLVLRLRGGEDRFSTFVPPKKAEAFKQEIYAARTDLGLFGRPTAEGYLLERVEKHSNAFKEGLRPGDLILQIDQKPLAGLDVATIEDWLKPEVNQSRRLTVRGASDGRVAEITLTAESYFAETVKKIPVKEKDVLVLQIQHFNQKTSDDLGDELAPLAASTRHLILDLRDNQGGPPLATREILGFFLPENDPLFFIVRKNRLPFLLSAARRSPRYAGVITVLVNEKTASAAETLSGVLREKGLARLVGHQTAGASYLKSLYDYADGSSVLLVTSRTFFHNQKVFPAQGLKPDLELAPEEDALERVIRDFGPGPGSESVRIRL